MVLSVLNTKQNMMYIKITALCGCCTGDSICFVQDLQVQAFGITFAGMSNFYTILSSFQRIWIYILTGISNNILILFIKSFKKIIEVDVNAGSV